MISNTLLFSFALQTVFLLVNTHQILVHISKQKKMLIRTENGIHGFFVVVVCPSVM